jgi:hypothetical protein
MGHKGPSQYPLILPTPLRLRRLVDASAEDCQKDRLRIGCANTRRIKLVGNERLDMPAPANPVAEKTVMHEQPSYTSERMTIHARDRSAGCSADVSEERVRLQMTAQVAEIFADENR